MILVTGTSGFIGRHLLAALIKTFGANALVALTSQPLTSCRYLIHNEYSFGKNFFIENGLSSVDTIIHAGSFIPKNSSQLDSWKECNLNISNTEVLLKANLPNLKRFIFLSTTDVYGATEVISESSIVNPASLYAASKRYIELMLQGWAKASNINLTILRVGHVYGPGEETFQKVIPVTMHKLLNEEKLRMVGDGQEVRSFIFVKDLVDCIVNGLVSSFNYEIINLAGSTPVKIEDVLKKLINISGHPSPIDFAPSDKPARNMVFDATKMKSLLNRSEKPIDEGLKEEWEHMKALYK